jgi:hypothetical protein
MTGRAALRRLKSATWLDSENLSILADSDRWLAHAVIVDKRWLVFNATHLSDSGRGFEFLGGRNSLEHAKELAERSIHGERAPILIEGWTPPSRETDSDPRIDGFGHLEQLLWHGALPNALERVALAVESAALTDGENWHSANYLADKLVETVERIGLLCVPQPARWLPLAEDAVARTRERSEPGSPRLRHQNTLNREISLPNPPRAESFVPSMPRSRSFVARAR